jgi:predicted PurR-regulated permease PerM
LIAIAALIALLLRSLVKWLSKYGVKPWMSAFLILGVLAALGASAWFFVIPNFAQEVQQLFSTTSGTLNEAETQAS